MSTFSRCAQQRSPIVANGRQQSLRQVKSSGFFTWEQFTSAALLLVLLLIAGIEPNPGPRWPCTVCHQSTAANSVCCSKCHGWVHIKPCSQLRSLKDYNQATFYCPICSTNMHHKSRNIPSVHESFVVLQLNINGLKPKVDELYDFLQANNVKIAAIQETKLKSNTSIKIPNYTILRRDRTKNGGGLAFLIHNSITFTEILNTRANDTLEELSIVINNTSPYLKITNIYIPPRASCPNSYKPSINHLLEGENSLLVGDFNAHSNLWHSPIEDDRGYALADEISESNMAILNEDTPTRLPVNGQPTSPDISLVSPSLLISSHWSTSVSLNSDHLPILIDIQINANTTTPKRTFINFSKADWNAFKADTERQFRIANAHDRNQSAPIMEKVFRSIISQCSSQHIPMGRRKTYIPCLSNEAKQLIKDRDNLRVINPYSRHIREISDQIEACIRTEKQNKWKSFLDTFTHKSQSHKLWQVVKSLDGKSKPIENCSIKFGETFITSNGEIANKLNQQFTCFTPHKSDKQTRIITRTVRNLKSEEQIPCITAELVHEAIRKVKTSTALGPDGIAPIHLKHLGPHGFTFLATLLYASIKSGSIPAIWKTSRIVPLLKPGKQPNIAESYRPISLLCPAVKILETLLLATMSGCLHLAEHQHGFRKQRSTTSALSILSNHVSEGFNKKQPPDRTVAVALDLTKAFDNVDHNTLIKKLSQSTLPNYVTKWLSNYLRGRQGFTCFRNATSSHRTIHTGVPQGSVISPLLFNYYISDLPTPPTNIQIISYADDLTIYSSGPRIRNITSNLNKYLPEVSQFLFSHKMNISIQKSTVTLFTPDKREFNAHPQVKINGTILPLQKQPKLLGVIFDTLHTFAHHAKSIVNNVRKRNNVLRALCGTSWGHSKETIIHTYKSIGRSIINYSAPVWTPLLSQTHFDKIQKSQNEALRIATGCHSTSSIDHLHQETNSIIPVLPHSQLLTDQYYTQCHKENHPCRYITQRQPPPRLKKHTLSTYSANRIEMTKAELLPDHTPNDIIKKLHTNAVATAIVTYKPNALLQRQPPVISPDEQKLSRAERCILSQLRSGWCSQLRSYKHHFNPDTVNECPKCQLDAHTVHHLFNCPAEPLPLTPISLWTTPLECARHLLPRLK